MYVANLMATITIKFNLMVALELKSDNHQNQWNSFSENHECLYQMFCQSTE